MTGRRSTDRTADDLLFGILVAMLAGAVAGAGLALLAVRVGVFG